MLFLNKFTINNNNVLGVFFLPKIKRLAQIILICISRRFKKILADAHRFIYKNLKLNLLKSAESA
jgi:hypothetical protein